MTRTKEIKLIRRRLVVIAAALAALTVSIPTAEAYSGQHYRRGYTRGVLNHHAFKHHAYVHRRYKPRPYTHHHRHWHAGKRQRAH